MQMKDGNHCLVGCFSVNWDPIVSFIELESLPGLVVSPWFFFSFLISAQAWVQTRLERGESAEILSRVG